MRKWLLLFLAVNSFLLAEDHQRPSPSPENLEKRSARPLADPLNPFRPLTLSYQQALRQPGKHLVIDPETHLLTSPSGKAFGISLINEEKLEEIFKKMSAQKHIPFCYPEDGCYARAHEMARLMEKENVLSAKVFLEGDLKVTTKNSPKGYVEWWYHVAPVVSVKKGKQSELYVIDPSLATKPLKVDDWVTLQTSHQTGKKDDLYHTKRFNYTPSSKKTDLEDYDPDDLKDTKQTLEKYLTVQNSRKKQ